MLLLQRIGINTITVVVEHKPDVLRQMDWLLELGPVGGDAGGHLMYCGVPEELKSVADSPTGAFMGER